CRCLEERDQGDGREGGGDELSHGGFLRCEGVGRASHQKGRWRAGHRQQGCTPRGREGRAIASGGTQHGAPARSGTHAGSGPGTSACHPVGTGAAHASSCIDAGSPGCSVLHFLLNCKMLMYVNHIDNRKSMHCCVSRHVQSRRTTARSTTCTVMLN